MKALTSLLRFIWLPLGLVLFFSTLALGQTDPEEKKEPPSEGVQDTLNRMKIKREEVELKKLIKSSEQAYQISQTISPLIEKESLGKPAEKKLHEIEKAAKQIRNSIIGSTNKEEEFTPPKNLVEAVENLTESCKKMNEQMTKTSRFVVSAAIIVSSNDVLRLVKILRTYIH